MCIEPEDSWEALVKQRSYEPSIAGLIKDFSEVSAQRDRLTVELVEILAAIRAMSLLSGEAGAKEPYVRDLSESIWQPKPNLTTAIEFVLRSSQHAMTPMEIKRALVERGYDLRKYSFAMAVIHGSLKSLLEAGLVNREILKDEYTKLYSYCGDR
jgi:hypothetical protein